MMNKLQRYLLKNSISIEEAQTTNSVYYNVCGVIIRYSDHLNNKGCDINIVQSINNPRFYIVTASNVGMAYVLNAKNVIQFIANSIAFIKITRTTTVKTVASSNGNVDMKDMKLDSFKEFVRHTFGDDCSGINTKFFITFKSKFPSSCSLSVLKTAVEWASEHPNVSQSVVSTFIKTL